MKKEKLILIGGGGHCKSCIDVIEAENKYEIAGIIDIKEKIGKNVLGYPIIGEDEDIENLAKEYNYFFITIGQIRTAQTRVEKFNYLKKLKITIPSIISPLAYVSKHTKIGEGTIIMHKTFVNADAQIGRNCIINTGSIIEHDVKVGDNCHISTGVLLNGGVQVGDNTFIGSGAITKEYITIPENSFIKAGSLLKGETK